MNKTNFYAISLLALMAILMFGSALGDSAIMDELAHIPAGFGYVTQFDYRLNPEHPPLLKALAAFSSWAANKPNFPTDTSYWQSDINGQWAEGAKFLYESGNNADKIIFWARFPLILLTLFFGWLIFRWVKKRFGDSTALLTFAFFALSPNFIAHGHYVTTDVGAAFGFFLGFAAFLNFLEKPSVKNIILGGVLLGIAELTKFSVVLLAPLYLVMLAAWAWSRPGFSKKEHWLFLGKLFYKTLILGLIGFLAIWLVYAVFTWNYPQARQFNDAQYLLSSYGFRLPVNLDLALIKNKFTRPLGQYLLGLLMVNQREVGGNTNFFLGNVSNGGSRWYFPLMYIFKEPLPFHILSLLALGFALKKIYRARKNRAQKEKGILRRWIWNYFSEFSAISLIFIYWLISVKSPLNIGVRHILPTFPFIYLLVSRQISEWLKGRINPAPQNIRGWLANLYQKYIASIPRYFLFFLLMLWLFLGTIYVYPNFLSYYNELAGGTTSGWKVATDSNYDWGQDLKRLTDFAKTYGIQKISLDYFGGGSPRYYLGDKFESWWSARGPASGWFAISATQRQGAFGKTIDGFIRKPEDSYDWLKPYEPVARAGESIFIYRLP